MLRSGVVDRHVAHGDELLDPDLGRIELHRLFVLLQGVFVELLLEVGVPLPDDLLRLELVDDFLAPRRRRRQQDEPSDRHHAAKPAPEARPGVFPRPGSGHRPSLLSRTHGARGPETREITVSFPVRHIFRCSPSPAFLGLRTVAVPKRCRGGERADPSLQAPLEEEPTPTDVFDEEGEQPGRVRVRARPAVLCLRVRSQLRLVQPRPPDLPSTSRNVRAPTGPGAAVIRGGHSQGAQERSASGKLRWKRADRGPRRSSLGRPSPARPRHP